MNNVYFIDMNCSICKKTFLSTYQLLNHVKMEHDLDKSFIIYCPTCSEKITSRYLFRLHLTNEHPIVRLRKPNDNSKVLLTKCSFCEFTHNEYSELLKHLKSHAISDCKRNSIFFI